MNNVDKAVTRTLIEIGFIVLLAVAIILAILFL